mgnify:CR=1 FL=1
MRWFLRLVFVLLISCAPRFGDFARAGAFMQPVGGWQIIQTLRFTGSATGFGADGRITPLPLYQKYELQTYLEYGLTDWLTLIAQPTLSRIFADGNPWGLALGITSVEAGARAKIAQFNDIVFSAQATAKIPTARDRTNPALFGNTGEEFDFRLLAGKPFELAGFTGFVDAQSGSRLRRDGPPDEIRLDLTIGFRPLPRLTFLAQSFNIIAPSAGQPGFPAMRQHKIQGSLVWDLSQSVSLQSGLFTTIASRKARREQGFVSGFWYRF